jgi:Tol biopolymer transport system component
MSQRRTWLFVTLCAILIANLVVFVVSRRPASTSFDYPGTLFVVVQTEVGSTAEDAKGAIIRVAKGRKSALPIDVVPTNIRVDRTGHTVAYTFANALYVTDGEAKPRELGTASGSLAWSPDGAFIVCSHGAIGEKGVLTFKSLRFAKNNSSAGEVLSAPPTDAIEDWSSDGKSFLTVRYLADGQHSDIYHINVNKLTERRLADGHLNTHPRFSPVEDKIVFIHQEKGQSTIRIQDVKSAVSAAPDVVYGPTSEIVTGCCWSNDGQWVAFTTPVSDRGCIQILRIADRVKTRLCIDDAKWIGAIDWR